MTVSATPRTLREVKPGREEKQAGRLASKPVPVVGRWYGWAAVLLAAVVLGFAYWFRERVFWDFRLCYAAGWLCRQGQNPFDNKLLFSIPNLDPMPFSYPLPVAYLFAPLTRLDYLAAAMLWYVVTSALLGLLVVFWWRQWGDSRRAPWFPLLSLLLFNLAVPKALLTGNVVTLETALLWGAFYFLAKGNLPGFLGCLLPAASFKMSPLLFLGLPLVHPQVRRWKLLGAGGALFAGYIGLAYGLAPGWFKDYQANVAFNVKEWSQADVLAPSTYALSRRVVSILFSSLPPQSALVASGALYAVIVACVVWVGWKVARVLAARPWAEAGRPAILYATLAYALVVPRMSDYSYILVIPAALYVAGSLLAPPHSIALFAALLLPAPFISFREPGSGTFLQGDFFFGQWAYWSLLMVFACWALFSRKVLVEARRQTKAAPGTRGAKR